MFMEHNCEQSKLEQQELKQVEQRQKTFNGLSATEWASLSSSVWTGFSTPRNKKQLDHGATYPEKLCDRLITMYSKLGDVVLDPFLGTDTTAISAIKNNRLAIGIELTDRFFKVASESIEQFGIEQVQLFHGDCAEKLKELNRNSIQLTVTSPPYADLIHKIVKDRSTVHKNTLFANATTNLYSDDVRDLGNMSLTEYIPKVEVIMKELFRVTENGGYNIWVVKDFRDTKHGIPYVDLHTKIANAGELAGFLYHDLIIWDQNANRRLVLLGYPSVFYVNQNHSYIVVMRKPN